MSDETVDRGSRRAVGVSVLKRLRGLVDGEASRRNAEARWARRLSWLFGLAALAAVLLLAFR